jgi:hypothetical protein
LKNLPISHCSSLTPGSIGISQLRLHFQNYFLAQAGPNHGYWGFYSELVEVYSRKLLTYDSDALNAVTAILTKLQESGLYPTGFHWGLPLDRFEDGLTWSSSSELVRREDFPSWSWLGWNGQIDFQKGYFRVDDIPPALSAWKVCSKKFERLVPGATFDNNGQVPEAMLEEPAMSPWLFNLDPVEASRLQVAKGYVLWLPLRNPSKTGEKSIRISLFNFVVKLVCNSENTFSKIMALGHEVTEHLCVLRLNVPEPGGMPELVLLDQARTASDADNSLIAVYSGWFNLLQTRFSLHGGRESHIADALKAHQELRTVFLR